MNITTKCIAALATFSVFACQDAGGQANASKTFSDFEEVMVTHSNCFFFNCPIAEIVISSDGQVRHTLPGIDDTGAVHKSRIDQHSLAQITKALHDARLDEMRDRYTTQADGCVHGFMDMPTTRLKVSRGEKYKNVTLDNGCIGPTVPTGRVNSLVKTINEVTGTTSLLERLKQVRRQDDKDKHPLK